MKKRLTPGWTLVGVVGLLVIAIVVILLVTVGTDSGSGSS